MKTDTEQPPAADEIARLIRAALEREDLAAGHAAGEGDSVWATRPDAVEEVGRRVAALADLCEERVTGRIRRLHAGLDAIAAAAGVPERAAWRAAAITYWPDLRAEVAALFRAAWLAAHLVASLHSRLAPEAQSEAERRFGPLSDAPGRYGPLWRAHWPVAELARADERARAAGIPGAPPASAGPDVDGRCVEVAVRHSGMHDHPADEATEEEDRWI
jgi:hypothetical protein